MAKSKLSGNVFYVYVLFRHDTGGPFYIGKGAGARWLDHERVRRAETNRHKVNIIRAAKRAGAEIPKVKVATDLNESDAFLLERLLIAAIGRTSVGGPLVNLTDGGEGESGKKYSAATLDKMRKAKLGRKLTQEHRANIKAALENEELCQRFRAVHQQRFLDPKVRAAAGAHNIGRKRSAETAAKQTANNPGHTGHTHSDAARAKISAKLKGKPWSERRRMAQLSRMTSINGKGEL